MKQRIVVKKQVTLDSWRAEGLQRGNGDLLDARFRCPLCGHTASPREFQDAGAEPSRAAQECIGRVIGAKGGMFVKTKPMPQPCDWAAFGLFGTLSEGIEVLVPDETPLWVFSFADEAPS